MNGLKKAALALAMLTAAALASCSSAAPAPSATAEATFAPVPSVAKSKAAVVIPSYYDDEKNYSGMLARMNGLLEKAGLNVEIRVKRGLNPSQDINTEASAGVLSATAYAMSRPESDKLYKSKITMDMTDMVRMISPVYYSKYSNLFPEYLSGIPVAIFERPLWLKPALMLREDFEQAGGGVSTVDAFFRFIDGSIVPEEGKVIVIAEPYYLINEWALEQGYYNVDVFGIRGYLYAALNDEACALVTLESIPGFSSFFSRLCAYFDGKALSNAPASTGLAQVVGYLASLHVYYTPHPYSPENWIPWVEGRFTAHGFSPDLPSHMNGPCYNMELAVPAAASGDAAADVVRFVEWLYSCQENYDSVMYGEKGVDFSLDIGRFTPLVEGTAVGMKPADQPSKFFFTWPGSSVLCNSDYTRVPSVAPANVEEVVNEGIKANLRFPLSGYIEEYADNTTRFALTGDAKSIAEERQGLLDSFLFGVPNALAIRTEDDVRALLDSLSVCRNRQLTEAYAGLIQSCISKAAE